MEGFDGLATFLKPAGQPVEEFGMGRLRAHVTEVVWGFNDAAAEMVMPNAIYDGATGEKVGGIGEPFRERGAAGPFVRGVCDFESGVRSGDGGDASGHD